MLFNLVKKILLEEKEILSKYNGHLIVSKLYDTTPCLNKSEQNCL